MNPLPISDVSDTARWVAVYRAEESERADALFRDPFARRLAGELGAEIARSVKYSMYTKWTVIIRTRLIDDWIHELIDQEGIDTVINLGAGLDTRPYRMELPTELNWIEVDYPHIIQYKEKILENEKLRCNLERFGLDLADRKLRQELFAKLALRSKKCLILTEGVVVYLTNDQVTELAQDLKAHPSFQFWIAEYLSPHVVKHLTHSSRMKHMKNAPFQFNPRDWYQHFAEQGWKERETRYTGELSIRLKRPGPAPWWLKTLRLFMSSQARKKYHQFSGFTLFSSSVSSSVSASFLDVPHPKRRRIP